MNWFWHALWIAFVVIPVTLLWIFCLVDTFLRRDLSGWAKAAWVIGILVFPVIGAVVYLVTRPYGGERELWQPAEVRLDSAPATDSTADELAKLDSLRSKGVLNDQEFAVQKAKLLGMPAPRAATADQASSASVI
jgi:hypothetical protein